MSTLQTLYSRPGMYISPYEQQIDAAGFITRFLDAILEPKEITCPDSIYVTVAGTYLVFEATDCWLDRELFEFDTFLSIFDPKNFQRPAVGDGYVMEIMRSIVWFSEYCLTNIMIRDKMFQQAFWCGTPLSGQPKCYLDTKTPKIGFCITLPSELFPNRMLEIERLERVIDLWEERLHEHGSKEVLARLHQFSKQWTQQSKHHFSLRLSGPAKD